MSNKSAATKACECGGKLESEAPASQLDAPRKQFTLAEKNTLLKFTANFHAEQIDEFTQKNQEKNVKRSNSQPKAWVKSEWRAVEAVKLTEIKE